MIREQFVELYFTRSAVLWAFCRRIADSSSTNAVSFSSARTTKRFPSSRCASAIQIVRPLESIAETQPQLQPALLRLSAMISQYFMLSLLPHRLGPQKPERQIAH